MVKYKQLCIRCKKNYVTMTHRNRYAMCYDCQIKDLNVEIKDKTMKKMFNIPEELYRKDAFLADIKIKYIRFGSLTDKQIAAFKKVAKQLQDGE